MPSKSGQNASSETAQDGEVKTNTDTRTLLLRAHERKIASIEKEERRKLSPEERSAIGLTVTEYDKFKDPADPSAYSVASRYQHSWSYALGKADLPAKQRVGSYEAGEVQKKIAKFKEDFAAANGLDPELGDYKSAQTAGLLPSDGAIKKNTRSTGLTDYLTRSGKIKPNHRANSK